MQTVTFKKAFPFQKGLNTTYYEPGFTGDVSDEVFKAATAAAALEEKTSGSDKAGSKGDAGSPKG
jgi:hypothetical protein